MRFRPPPFRSILICIGLFFLFLLLRFPYQNLRGYLFGKIYTASGVYITADELSPVFLGWPGLKMQKVDILTPPHMGGMSLSSEQLTVRGGLTGIFPPVPFGSFYFQGLKEGGDLYAWGGQGGARTRAAFQGRKVNLKQLSIPGMNGNILGELNGNGNVDLYSDDLSKTTGVFDLEVKGLQLPAQTPMPGITIVAMNMGTLKARINMRNGSAEIANLQFGDPNSDASGSLSGDLKFGKEFSASFLNLTLRIKLSERFRQNPQAATTVSFLQTFQTSVPGEYAMKWSASFDQMRENLYAALPQAVR